MQIAIRTLEGKGFNDMDPDASRATDALLASGYIDPDIYGLISIIIRELGRMSACRPGWKPHFNTSR